SCTRTPPVHSSARPMAAERGTLGAEKLASLSALEVRVEDESRFIDALEKDDAHAGVGEFVHRAERERRRLGKNVPWKRLGLLEQRDETRDRISGRRGRRLGHPMARL